ncbi:MAG: hypothetical protein ACREAE_08320 [Nitrosopumilaceae archaeon]
MFLLLFIGYKGGIATYKHVFAHLVIFNFILVFGALLNFDYLYPKAAISQIIMWNEPIILFLILVNLPFSLQDIKTFNKLLFFLIVFEFIVGIIQVPIYLKTGESESIIGTFHGNAEQYADFLMIGIFYLFGKSKTEPARKILYNVIIPAMLALILLIENKASWIGIGLSVMYLLHRMGRLEIYVAHKMKYIFIFSLLLLFALFVIFRSASTLHKYAAIEQAWQSGNFFNLGKMKAYRDTFMSYNDKPYMALVGSGPGTFYSRASNQFFELTEDMFIIPLTSLLGKKEEYRASDSMGGVIKKAEMESFFKTFFFESKIYLTGSGTVDDPFFSFVALLGETGLAGTFIYLGIYIIIFKKLSFYFDQWRDDSMIFPLIASTLGFLVYIMVISIYNNWLETGRLTTILWSMIAMVLKYGDLTATNELSGSYKTSNAYAS